MKLFSSPLVVAAYASLASADISPIVVKGNKFFYKDGAQFFMKGVAYQQDTGAAAAAGTGIATKYIDPLADEKLCKRDVPLLKELGTNTIRTYAIDPDSNHDACMKLLEEAGIYVVADLGEPQLSINREEPHWDTPLFERYKKVVDALSKYDNVLGYFAGNEVTNSVNNTAASAFVKAAIRDTKKYIKEKHSSRWIGVGYASNDDEEIRVQIANYFNCDSEEESADFWGYNIYSWCGESTMQKSGYDDQADFYRNYSIPVFFAEYGCNDPGGAEGRKFQDAEVLYKKQMTDVFSGGIVYMYFQEDNDYGLVEVKNGKANKMKNFHALKKAVTDAKPQGLKSASDASSSLSMAQCPTLNKKWKASKDLPPVPNKDLCECMVKSRSCVPKDNVSSTRYGGIFDFICSKSGDNLCAGISGNATSGQYGAYSMCDDTSKLAFAMDAYYQKQGGKSCSFDGAGKTQDAEESSTCKDMLKKAKEAPGPSNKSVEEQDSGVSSMASVGWAVSIGAAAVHLFGIGF
ncbi:hypothetical protein Golomagni_06191 [Golovinomyces magnicellulatus]|nr:hypothetical protein Golomagni_06191 [Golovinomyces magnicellulatus]